MKKLMALCMIGLVFTLSGCLYPNDKRAENRIPYKDQIQSVQSAVEDYHKDTSILPIKNSDQSTGIYEKYRIDFGRLIPKYMQKPPGNSYENGGTFQYVLVDAETKPKVKLIDLVTVNRVQEFDMRLKDYIRRNKYPPFEHVLGNGYFTLNYKELGLKSEPFVVSPFSGKHLPLIIDSKYNVYVDYSMDLYEALHKYKHHYKTGQDIRDILVDHSNFVPAFSVPYTVKKNEPVFLTK
ncbi:hypothetical protein WD019_04970 [Fictibacillus sp. Mic-4]|uniref:hypothetical protein n=1 Tax=Fictibacillus sp. Mic-4 TaxID=3132826 RepID=UPI003CF6DA3E